MSLTEAYLTYLLTDRNYSRNTIATYRRTYATFPDIETADRAAVEAWWGSRTRLAPASRANELAAVRSFYAWCRVWEHRGPTDDPTHRLRAPKSGTRQPRPISRADLHSVLLASPPDVRRAMCLGAYGGLRVAEAAALDWSAVDEESKRIIVRGKGDKERPVGLPPLLLDSLLPRTGGNVVTAGGSAYSPGRLQQKVNAAIRDAGVSATFHNLRARFATVALGGGVNLLAVSRALGHASPAVTTAIYAATADADLDLIGEAVTR